MESDKKIKNPDASFIWTTSAGSSSNTFYFSNGTKGIYHDEDNKTPTTLTCNSTKSLYGIYPNFQKQMHLRLLK